MFDQQSAEIVPSLIKHGSTLRVLTGKNKQHMKKFRLPENDVALFHKLGLQCLDQDKI
jgi:hypothetical protein